MRKRRMAALALVMAAALGAVRGEAQVMADRVPSDAVVYAGWAGTDATASAYDGSHLKAFLNTLNLPQFIAQQIQENISREADAMKARMPAQAVADNDLLTKQWLLAMVKSPTAIYFNGIDFPTGGEPVPHLGLFSKVGKETAEALAGKLDAAMHQGSNPEAPLRGVVAVGDYLLAYVGDKSMADRLAGTPPADNLAASPDYSRSV